jgi:hypothetical protein
VKDLRVTGMGLELQLLELMLGVSTTVILLCDYILLIF